MIVVHFVSTHFLQNVMNLQKHTCHPVQTKSLDKYMYVISIQDTALSNHAQPTTNKNLIQLRHEIKSFVYEVN